MILQSEVIGGNNGNRGIQKYQNRLYAENRRIWNQEQGTDGNIQSISQG